MIRQKIQSYFVNLDLGLKKDITTRFHNLPGLAV